MGRTGSAAVDVQKTQQASIFLADKSLPKKGNPKSKGKPKTGLFGRIRNSILKPLVSVPGGGKGKDLFECVFCKGSGFCDCDACRGTGKDAMGTCLMCSGKTSLMCTVCSGIGTVDLIRRGGTDDSNQYITKKK